MQTSDLVCPFCVSARSALKFDRKSRPYFACKGCGARSFLIAIRDAVRSLAVVQPLLAARLEELEADPTSPTDFRFWSLNSRGFRQGDQRRFLPVAS